MVYTSDELKEASFAVLEDDVVKKIVFKKKNDDFLEIDLTGAVPIPPGTYVPGDPILEVTYNGDGTVATSTENGIITTYTYNTNGTVATSTRLGVVRTYTYVGENLTEVS